MANRYYINGTDAEIGWYALHNSGALLNFFAGLNLMTDADTTALDTFSEKPSVQLASYLKQDTGIRVYLLETLKRAIYTFTSARGFTTEGNHSHVNTKTYPEVVYLQAQGRGGDGGFDAGTDQWPGTYGGGGGGGSGYNDKGYVVLQPGDSLEISLAVTAAQTTVTATLSTSSRAYTNINGARYVGNAGTMTLVASAGSAGGASAGGSGYRNGGNQGASGGNVAIGAETLEGYATQSFNRGGPAGTGGGGGGGASLYMRANSTDRGYGGGGASFSGYTAIGATLPFPGAGGGGSATYYYSGSYHYAAQSSGGAGCAYVYYY